MFHRCVACFDMRTLWCEFFEMYWLMSLGTEELQGVPGVMELRRRGSLDLLL